MSRCPDLPPSLRQAVFLEIDARRDGVVSQSELLTWYHGHISRGLKRLANRTPERPRAFIAWVTWCGSLWLSLPAYAVAILGALVPFLIAALISAVVNLAPIQFTMDLVLLWLSAILITVEARAAPSPRRTPPSPPPRRPRRPRRAARADALRGGAPLDAAHLPLRDPPPLPEATWHAVHPRRPRPARAGDTWRDLTTPPCHAPSGAPRHAALTPLSERAVGMALRVHARDPRHRASLRRHAHQHAPQAATRGPADRLGGRVALPRGDAGREGAVDVWHRRAVPVGRRRLDQSVGEARAARAPR